MHSQSKGSRSLRKRVKSTSTSSQPTTNKPKTNEKAKASDNTNLSKLIDLTDSGIQSSKGNLSKSKQADKIINAINKQQEPQQPIQESIRRTTLSPDQDEQMQTSEAYDTQGDITSFDCISESLSGPAYPMPSYWNPAGIQQSLLPPPPPPIYAHPMSHQQQPPPMTIYSLPNFNSQLPFPDRSGSMPHQGYNVPQFLPQAPYSPPPCGYPTVYVSAAGLITVLLKYDIAVELTVDRNIRVVNHRHKAVAATNSRGSVNCVYHVAAKVYQDGTKTEAEIFGERRARMQTEGILFSSGMEVYLLDENHIVPSHFCFNDMSKDCSVNILFPTTDFSNELLLSCEDITKNSRYYFHKNGSTTIIINNIKIHQDEFGEVQVTSGPKFITTSPVYGNIYLQSHFVEISVQVNWNVSVKRGSHQLSATYTNFVVSNGDHEAGFDQFRDVFSRLHNPTVSEFENWLPSLTFLCQGLPNMRAANKQNHHKFQRQSEKALGCSDPISEAN